MSNSKAINGGKKRREQNFLGGAATLVAALAGVKILGAIYKIFINGLLEGDGSGYFNTAYDIYTPFYAIALAGLPIALARMVSGYAVRQRYKDVRRLRKVAQRAYFVTGTLSFVVLLAAAWPLLNFIGNTSAIFCVLFIAPSLLFCCVMSSYRGYYNGLHNMVPTAVSQLAEGMGRMVFGLVLAYGTNGYLNDVFQKTGKVFGKVITEGYDEVKDVIIPVANMAQREISKYNAAAAIIGVTLGAAVGALFLFIRDRKGGDGITAEEIELSPKPESSRTMLKMLVTIAIPVVIGSLVTNASGMIDSVMVQRQLSNLVKTHGAELAAQYTGLIKEGAELPNFLYGCYKGFAYSIYNLVPTLSEALAVSALTTLAALWVKRNNREIKYSIESTVRITAMIAMPAGLGISVLSGPILSLLYRNNPGEVAIATPLLQFMGISAVFAGLAAPLTSMLQAIGKQNVPVINMVIGMVMKIAINYTLVGVPSVNIRGAAMGSLVCYSFIVVADFICLCKYSRVVPNILKTLIKPAVCAGLSAAAAWAVNGLMGRVVSSSSLCTIAAIAAAGLTYILAIALTRTLVKDDVLMMPKGERLAAALTKMKIIG